MQKKWLLDFEIKEARKLAKSKAPQRNKNQQERDRAQQQAPLNLTDEDRHHIRTYSVLMPLAAGAVRKLDKILLKATTEDSRSTGIGSYGGHIARGLKLPGPLNGLEVYEQETGCVTSPYYVKLKKRKEKIVAPSDDTLNPPWNQNFVTDHQARTQVQKEEKDDEYSKLKQEMRLFLSRPPACGSGSGADSKPGTVETAETSSTLQLDSNYIFPSHLPEEASEEWIDMRQVLQQVAAEVLAQDLLEVSSWVKPPSAAIDILGYLCTLLGINPDWATAKRLLLRNIPIFVNFLHKIEPTQLPVDRLGAASNWREQHIPVLSHVGMEKVNRALARLTKWVLHFNRMIAFYICAKEDDDDSSSVMTIVKAKHMERQKQKQILENSLSDNVLKRTVTRGESRSDINTMHGHSKRHVRRGGSKQHISRGNSFKNGRGEAEPEVSENHMNMRELITRNVSISFSKEKEDVVEEGWSLAPPLPGPDDPDSRPVSSDPDPILGKRRQSVVSQIFMQDRRASLSSNRTAASVHSDSKEENNSVDNHRRGSGPNNQLTNKSNSPHATSNVSPQRSSDSGDAVFPGSTVVNLDNLPANFESQFWKSIGAAFMLDDKGQIILSNGKDIGLYQDMLLCDETVTSDYSKYKLSGSDLALTTRRRKIVAENRDMIHNFVGKLIKQASNEFSANMSSKL